MLTRRSSRSASGGRLSLFVSTTETHLYCAHAYSNGIHFLKRCSALGWSFFRASPAGAPSFSSILASSHFSVSESSYCFCSAVPLRWRSAARKIAGGARCTSARGPKGLKAFGTGPSAEISGCAHRAGDGTNARGKPRRSTKCGGHPKAELVGVGLTNWLGW